MPTTLDPPNQSEPQEIVRFTYRPVPRRLREVVFNGRKITIGGLAGEHIVTRVGRRLEFYELGLLEVMAMHAPRPIGVAIDVGANIGNHSVFFGVVLGARVLCVEPSAREVGLLRWNLEHNGLTDQSSVFQGAAGAKSGQVKIKEVHFAGNVASHQVVPDDEPGEVVALQSVDDIVEDAFPGARVSILKVDVDGFERDVLEGSRGIIERDKPLISVELQDDEITQWVHSLLDPLGYEAIGPFAGTPTYVFSTEFRGIGRKRLLCHVWKDLTRGRHLRAVARMLGEGTSYPDAPR